MHKANLKLGQKISFLFYFIFMRFDFVRERLVHTLSIGIEAWDILFRSIFCLSTMATPSCPKFIPVEHSGIASISKPDGKCNIFVICISFLDKRALYVNYSNDSQ